MVVSCDKRVVTENETLSRTREIECRETRPGGNTPEGFAVAIAGPAGSRMVASGRSRLDAGAMPRLWPASGDRSDQRGIASRKHASGVIDLPRA